jgi:hypothetical protein
VHGDTWRVYFLNDICATGYLDLTSAVENGFKYIRVTSPSYNPNLIIRNDSFGTQIGLFYPTGEGKTEIYCNQYGIRSNYKNQDGGNYNGYTDSERYFGNANSVKAVKL